VYSLNQEVPEHEETPIHDIRRYDPVAFSALWQIVLLVSEDNSKVFYGLAVTDQLEWERQLKKVPRRVKELLSLRCILVSEGNAREI